MTPDEIVVRWANDAELFVTEGLRVEPTAQQRDGLRALTAIVWAKLRAAKGIQQSEEDDRLARLRGLSIMSGQGTGKDGFAAWVVLWVLFCFKFSKVPCTAPTKHQLHDVLWAEIHKWIRHADTEHLKIGSDFRMSDWITWQAEKVYFTELAGREWFAVPRTVNIKGSEEDQGETLAGFHEDFLFYIVDEATKVPRAVFRPIEGSMTGRCNLAVLIFNPTIRDSYAVSTHYGDKTAYWYQLHWSSEESELVPQQLCEDDARQYGRDSNFYRIRRLGLPPNADPDQLIQWDWLELAVGRELEALDDDPLVMTIDVARFGDDRSAILFRRGPVVHPIRIFKGLDTEQVANWAMALAATEEPDVILVDTIGVGAGVADKLRHRQPILVIDVNVQELASEDERFHRLRDELWWRTREDFEAGRISLPHDSAALRAQLGAPKYEYIDGKLHVESKKKIKARLGGEGWLDEAEALIFTRYFSSTTLRQIARVGALRSETRHSDARAQSWRDA